MVRSAGAASRLARRLQLRPVTREHSASQQHHASPASLIFHARAAIQPPNLPAEDRSIQRQAFSGLLWSKQFYHYGVGLSLDGDPAFPPPPPERRRNRNAHWASHFYANEVLQMPDKFEYPWFACWDAGLQMLPTAIVDPEFAKRQLILYMREWYMHPSGALPAYEYNFDDLSPPVHAYACWRVYQITKRVSGGVADLTFLERCFHKLLLNFSFWANKKVRRRHERAHQTARVRGGALLRLLSVCARQAPAALRPPRPPSHARAPHAPTPHWHCRTRAATTCSRAASWAWTISACLTGRRSRGCPRACASSRRTPRRGWPCTAPTCCPSRWSWRRPTPATRTLRPRCAARGTVPRALLCTTTSLSVTHGGCVTTARMPAPPHTPPLSTPRSATAAPRLARAVL